MKKDAKGRLVPDPIHEWFGLTYASYFVMPRVCLQSLPLEWQKRFVELMDEAYELCDEIPDYHVLRDDPEYTHVKKYDSEDEMSRDFEFTAWRTDPFANYKRPEVKALKEEG